MKKMFRWNPVWVGLLLLLTGCSVDDHMADECDAYTPCDGDLTCISGECIILNVLDTNARNDLSVTDSDTGVDDTEPIPPATPDGLEWVSIPGGDFVLAGWDGLNHYKSGNLTIPDFELTRNEITVGQWKECLADGMCADLDVLAQDPADDESITNVTWYEASMFCAWVGGHLPSEARWFYAATDANIGVPADQNADSCIGEATALGLCDLTDAVLGEWNADCFHSDLSDTPIDGSAWSAPNYSSRVQSGSWTWRQSLLEGNGGQHLRAWERPDKRFDYISVRCER